MPQPLNTTVKKLYVQSSIDDSGLLKLLSESLKIIETDGLQQEKTQTLPLEILHQPAKNVESLVVNLSKLSEELQLIVVSAKAIASDPASIIESIRQSHSDKYLPIIVMGVENDNEIFVQALRGGANDFLTLGLSSELVAEKLITQIRARNTQTAIAEQHELISEHHAHILREQQMAKAVFDKVAHELIELENLRYWLSPIAVFNGDVLLATPTPSGGLLVLMGDFTGHGLGAAIGAIPLASTFYGMALKGFAIHDIVKELNTKLYEILPTDVFCCACITQLDFASNSAEIWNAGLPDGYILRAGSSEVEAVSSSALPLGILPTRSFSFNSKRYNLEQGDKLYLLSDGLLETENETGEQYGEDRLKKVLVDADKYEESSGFDAIKENVLKFIGSNERADDISLVEIDFIAADDFARMHKQDNQSTPQEPVSWCFSYEFRADSLKHQDPVPLILHALLQEPSLRQYSGRLFSIVSELFNNALDHGLLELSSTLKHQADGFANYYENRAQRLLELDEGSVRFQLNYEASASEGMLTVDVIDTGAGFDLARIDTDNNNQPALHGRGLALVKSICENVEFLENGNHVRVAYKWQ